MSIDEILQQVQDHQEKQTALDAAWEDLREEARQECINLIKTFKFSSNELNFDKEGNCVTPKAPNAGEPKFQNPDGPETWTGRGKRPRWYIAAREAGFTDNDLLIKKK